MTTMHILAGKYKYRKVELTKHLTFNPIVTTIRESIFNVLNNYLEWDKAYVCDLFAGSGILGLEALSWNSKFCFFNDVNCSYSQTIEKNCLRLQAENVSVFCGSHLQCLLKIKSNKTTLDLVFLDPPYQKKELIFQSVDLLLDKQLLNDQGIVVVRTNQKIFWNKYPHLSVLTSKLYGQHHLYFLRFAKNSLSAKTLNLQNSKLLIISGPSGVGKKTIINSLLAKKTLNLVCSTSVTTRLPRANEQDGLDYHFFSVNAFEKAITRHDFIEYAQYLGCYYGTSKTYVQKLIDQGKNVLFEIELIGALEIKKQFPQATWIFLFPPSYAELRRRIEERGTESVTQVTRRLQKAQQEMQQVREENLADLCLINETTEITVAEIVNFVQKEWNK